MRRVAQWTDPHSPARNRLGGGPRLVGVRPAGLDSLHGLGDEVDSKPLAELIRLCLCPDQDLPPAFVTSMARFRRFPVPEVRVATAAFLLNRTREAEIRLGLEFLESLPRDSILELSELTARTINRKLGEDLLLAELRRATAEDDGTGPGGNAGRLLQALLDPVGAQRLRTPDILRDAQPAEPGPGHLMILPPP